MKIKKIFILIFSLFVLFTMTSCTNDVSMSFYEDITGGKTIVSDLMVDNSTTCKSPDGYFTLTISTKTLKTKLATLTYKIVANPDKINKNIYVETKNITTSSDDSAAPKLYTDMDDVSLSSMFTYDKYEDSNNIRIEIDSASYTISEYNYYLNLSFAGNDYKFKLF
ncbi:MAG: hypothetical protein K6E20_00070 [Acholeplasmatales bacterium]|nr:hypothetical protein [Acholeplasmatales bacterium]